MRQSYEVLNVIESKNWDTLLSNTSSVEKNKLKPHKGELLSRLPVNMSVEANIWKVIDALGIRGFDSYVGRNKLKPLGRQKFLAKCLLALKLLKRDKQGKLIILDNNKVCFDSKKLVGKRVQPLGKEKFKLLGFRHRDGRSLPITFDWMKHQWKKEENQENLKTIEANCELVVMNPLNLLSRKGLEDVRADFYSGFLSLLNENKFTADGGKNKEIFDEFEKNFREKYCVKDKEGKIIRTKFRTLILKRRYQKFLSQMHDVSDVLILPVVTTFNVKIEKLNQKVEKLESKVAKRDSRIDELDSENNRLKKRVRDLERRLDLMEKQR